MRYKVNDQNMPGHNRAFIIYWAIKLSHEVYNKHVAVVVTQSYPTLCDPMDCSTPGFPDLRHLPELTQTHGH